MAEAVPRNPFYLALLLSSLLFAVNAVAYAVIPTIEERSVEAGQPMPASPWRDALRENGWKWLLYELAAMVVSSFLSMGLDRLRTLQRERHTDTIPSADRDSSSS